MIFEGTRDGIRYGIASCALALIACNGCNDKNAAPANSPASSASTSTGGEVVVHAEDDGKAIDVARGGMVAFKLANNSGTGYVWTATPADVSVLAQQGDRTVESAADAPGGPQSDVLRFAASNAGTTVVELALKRPFGNAPAARTLHVTVNVH